MARPNVPNLNRRRDLKAALRRAKSDDVLRLEDLASAWGVVKTRFVNIKNDITMTIGFPSHAPGPNNTHLYPARQALEKMLEWETRNDETSTRRQNRAAAILGAGQAGQGDGPLHNPNELVALNRLAADIEEREREQGLWIRATEVAAKAADTFSIVSEFLSNLENAIDPNGRLPVEIREKIHSAGRETLISVHGQMKDMLNADSGSAQPQARGSGKPRARRKSG